MLDNMCLVTGRPTVYDLFDKTYGCAALCFMHVVDFYHLFVLNNRSDLFY